MLSARLNLWLCAVLLGCGQIASYAQLFLVGERSPNNSPDPGAVALGWNPSPDPRATGYFLCWGLASTDCTNFLDVGNVTNVTVAGLVPNVGYYFTIVTYDAAGDQSPPSNQITATITPADPVVTTWPKASAITYGQTLAASTLSGGSATPAGTFAFTTPSTAPNAGTAMQSVTYTPTDTTYYNTASSTVSVTVNKASTATALVSSANPSLQGSNVAFTVTVTPAAPASTTPTGNVQFYTNGVAWGSPVALTDGVANLSTADLPPGTNTVLAAYLGDSNFLGSSNSLAQIVQVVPGTPSTIGIQNNADGTVTVTFAGTPDAQYVVQASDNLAPPAWENVSTNTAGTDGQWTFTESTEHQPARFYRSARP